MSGRLVWRASSEAPFSEPLPPITIRPSIPRSRRWEAAFFRASGSLNSGQRPERRTVPPRLTIPATLRASMRSISLSIRPRHPRCTPMVSMSSARAVRITARMQGFRPGQSPPLVSSAIRFKCGGGSQQPRSSSVGSIPALALGSTEMRCDLHRDKRRVEVAPLGLPCRRYGARRCFDLLRAVVKGTTDLRKKFFLGVVSVAIGPDG